MADAQLFTPETLPNGSEIALTWDATALAGAGAYTFQVTTGTTRVPSGTSLAMIEKINSRPLAVFSQPDRAWVALSVPVLAQIRPASGVPAKRRRRVPSTPPTGIEARYSWPHGWLADQRSSATAARGEIRL